MRLLITAGPTHEPIDAVRYLANRSSGRLGIALAEAARDAGHNVTLLLGPTPIDPPAGIDVRRYTSTADLHDALDHAFPACDVLVMAAAVADYTPRLDAAPDTNPHGGKLSRGDGDLWLRLTPTPDLVAGVAKRRRHDQRVVAFALEPADTMIDRAARKLTRKGVDAIVANPLDTPDATDVDAAWLTRGQPPKRPGRLDKAEFGRWLIDRIGELPGEPQK